MWWRWPIWLGMDIRFDQQLPAFGTTTRGAPAQTISPLPSQRPPTAGPVTVEHLQALHHQQSAELYNFLGSLGGSSSSPGLGSMLATPAAGGMPGISDPKGQAMDFLLGSTGGGGNAGDIFSLALTANGQGLEATALPMPQPSTGLPPSVPPQMAEQAYRDVASITQMVEQVRQSSIDTLLNLGGNSGTDLSSLV